MLEQFRRQTISALKFTRSMLRIVAVGCCGVSWVGVSWDSTLQELVGVAITPISVPVASVRIA